MESCFQDRTCSVCFLLHYDLTWHDIYIILSSTFLPEEKERVSQASQAHADEIHRIDDTKPIKDSHQAVPLDDPNRDYQAGRPGWAACNNMVACLVVRLQKAGHKPVNFDKLQEISQRLDENPAQFLDRLTEALQKYTKLDPTSAEGTIVLNTHFISQSSPDIWKKLRKAEEGPQTPQQDLLNLAFKIFNNQEKQAKLEKAQQDQAE